MHGLAKLRADCKGDDVEENAVQDACCRKALPTSGDGKDPEAKHEEALKSSCKALV